MRIFHARLGREAMQAVEKLTSSTASSTVSAVMKNKLADALASGDTQAIVDLSSRIAVAQPGNEEEQALPYRQATAQRQ